MQKIKDLSSFIFDYILNLIKTFCAGLFLLGLLILFVAIPMYWIEELIIFLLVLIFIYIYPKTIIFFWERARYLGPPTTIPAPDLSLEVSWDK
ncbi:MAG: hypothetical protein ACD_7C00396G0001 [uncultured bacterium]|nr:MAG: hypothetical protein ACD_7C00396G0001 [uncultured bacterium]